MSARRRGYQGRRATRADKRQPYKDTAFISSETTNPRLRLARREVPPEFFAPLK